MKGGRSELKERAKELRGKGLTYKEIARELGIAPSTAWRLVNERRMGLKELTEKVRELEGNLERVAEELDRLREYVIYFGERKLRTCASRLEDTCTVLNVPVKPYLCALCPYYERRTE